MRSADEQHTSTSTHHHDANEERVKLPTEPGTDAEGVVWRRALAPHEDYLVSDDGRIVSLKRDDPHQMSPKINQYGYAALSLCNDGDASWHYVARLVWQAHRDPIPDGFEVHHVNGEKLDNRIENLEAVSGALHRRQHTAKLTEQEAGQIRWIAENANIDRQHVANHFGVSKATVKGIARRRSWTDIEPERPPRTTIDRIRQAA